MQQGPLFPPENPYAAPGTPPYAAYAQPPQQWGAGMPAGFWVRAGARVVDGMITGAIAFVIGFVLAMEHHVHAAQIHPGDDLWSTLAAIYTPAKFASSVAAALSYNVLSEVLTGATLGKMMFGLRVRSENGGPITFGGAVVRNLLYYIDMLVCGVVAYAFMSNSQLQQRLGDRAGKAVVVSKPAMEVILTRPPEAGGNPMGIVLGLLGFAAFTVLNLFVS